MGLSEIISDNMIILVAIALLASLIVFGMIMVSNEGHVMVSAYKSNLIYQQDKYTVIFTLKATSKYSNPLFLKQVEAIVYTEAGVKRYTLASDRGVSTGIVINGISDPSQIQQYIANNKFILNPNHEMDIIVSFNKLDITIPDNKIYSIIFQLTFETPSGKILVFTSNEVSIYGS